MSHWIKKRKKLHGLSNAKPGSRMSASWPTCKNRYLSFRLLLLRGTLTAVSIWERQWHNILINETSKTTKLMFTEPSVSFLEKKTRKSETVRTSPLCSRGTLIPATCSLVSSGIDKRSGVVFMCTMYTHLRLHQIHTERFQKIFHLFSFNTMELVTVSHRKFFYDTVIGK